MSPINFDLLQAEYPDFADVWAALRGWFAKNAKKKYIELTVLLRALPQVDRLRLILGLQAMIDSGMLEVAYRVKAPGGYLLEGDYEEPTRIPAELWDIDGSGLIRKDESDIVSGYRWESTDAA